VSRRSGREHNERDPDSSSAPPPDDLLSGLTVSELFFSFDEKRVTMKGAESNTEPANSGAAYVNHPNATHTGKMIGVFTAELDDAYQTALWRGIERRAAERGVGLIGFLGSRINSPLPAESAANVAYYMADHRNIDGLIVLSAAIMTFISPADLTLLFTRERRIPQVSIGIKVPDHASITVDGTDGIIEMIRHLKEVHRRSSIALIGGPPSHQEALERKQAFLKALELLGLKADERLFTHGRFIQESGVDAARKLLAQGVPFDALVCMNDRMAIGAMTELRKAGVRVPEDVSVVGFDSIEESASTMPPLTTIVQPFDEIGAAAVDVVMELMDGRQPSDRVLYCRPAFRETCGCPPGLQYRFALASIPESASQAERQQIEWLIEILETGNHDTFIAELNHALLETAFSGRDLRAWNDYLSYIRIAAEARMPADRPISGTLFEFARTLVGAAESRRQTSRRIQTERKFAALRSVSVSLSGAFEIPVLLSRLEDGMAHLGMRGCSLVLFEGRGKVPEHARLLMTTGICNVWRGCIGVRFPAASILPPEAGDEWKKDRWVLEPLVFQNEPLGYLLFAAEPAEPTIYDSLREDVSTALKGALVFEQIRTHEHRLEAQVARRTAELTRANIELRTEIERRTRLEQEVIEISNQTMERIGQDLHDDLCQHLAGISMFVSVVRNNLPPSSRNAALALDRIGEMLSDSISRVKQIARGLMPVELDAPGFISAVEALVESLRHRYDVRIGFSASSEFRVADRDRALQIFRIIQEALSNALKHSGSHRIDVNLYVETDGRAGGGAVGTPSKAMKRRVYVAEVTDYGTGFPEQPVHEGMGLRIMRYRAEKAEAELRIERLSPGTRVSCRTVCGKEDAV
jgi:DNA-binding LacI/PurR family transcriptional regulator/signal transduction histidine kinase